MPEAGVWKELLRAAGDGDTSLVQNLLEVYTADPNYQHPEYFTSPLFEAIRAGHLETIRLLLDSGASLYNKEDLTGCTPLEVALQARHHAVIDLLLEKLPEEQHHDHVIKTILVSGSVASEELLEKFIGSGHRVLIDEDPSTPLDLIETLKENTGNHKVSITNMVPSEISHVTNWILREDENLLAYLNEYTVLMDLERILVVTNNPSPSVQLRWLLRNNHKSVAVTEPRSRFMETWLDFDWKLNWKETVWFLLHTPDTVEGILYNYRCNPLFVRASMLE